MLSLKPSNDQSIRKFKVDVIPTIDLESELQTLCSTFETINSILRSGESHQKLECVKRVILAGYTKNKSEADNYVTALIESKVFETMLDIMKYEDYNDIIFKNDDTRELNIKISTCMTSFTYRYSSVGEVIAKAGGISYLTDICRYQPFLDKLENEHIYEFIEDIVATLHNIARMSSISKYFCDSKTAEAMVPLFSCKKERLQIYATLAAAQTCDSSKIRMLVDTKGVIWSMLKYLKKATEDPDYVYEGAGLLELLDGIDKLACADPNKKKILEAGALPIFQTILNINRPTEQALTARIVWTLTFDDEVASHVKASKPLVERLEILSKSTDQVVRSNVMGLLYNIGYRLEKKDEPTQKQVKHLFISYSWKEKEIVLKLNDLLQKKGVPIWIDIEKMRGSTLEAMANAVENAGLVLICMSENYKRSPNCRLESENIFRCNKEFIPLIVQKHYKPDGWLGALLGSRLYIDFSGKYKFDLNWKELIKELQTCQMLKEEEKRNETTKVIMPDQASSPLNPKTFTIQDVKQWLSLHKLEKCYHHFEDVNGKGLLQLKRMQHAAPEFYFKTLSRKLKLSLGEILNFSAALEEL